MPLLSVFYESIRAYECANAFAFSADFSDTLVSQNDRLALVLSLLALIVQKHQN
jgi:hypothetical protein